MRKEQIDRFWSKVIIKGLNDCWEFSGCKFNCGYGAVSINYRKEYAHRVAYKLFYGPISKGKFICHTCDNKVCCNPLHLYCGTMKDNLIDSVRVRKGLLSLDKVRLIRKLKIPATNHQEKPYYYSATLVGEVLKTSPSTIRRIWNSPPNSYLSKDGIYC